jgi:hypothetical protein
MKASPLIMATEVIKHVGMTLAKQMKDTMKITSR